jgi:hypothetical protein
MKRTLKGANAPRIKVKAVTRELEEYLLEEEKPIQPDLFYQELHGTRDTFIRASIRNNY